MRPRLRIRRRCSSRSSAESVRPVATLDFEAFMQLALYAPGLGYYSAGSRKIGAAGDFTTAPEVSELFARCVARQCAQILTATAGGNILELGAGTGSMAATVLRELAARDALPAYYDILEVSADLADRQRQHLMQLPRSAACAASGGCSSCRRRRCAASSGK